MRFFIFAVVALAISSCGSHPCPVHPYRDALQVLRDHASMRRDLVSVKAEARVDQRGENGRIRGAVLMLAERPERVRLDVMTQFGPIAILTADQGRFSFTDFREKRFMEGKSCPANIARLLGINMTAEQATQLLLGDAPIVAGTAYSSVQCTRDGCYDLRIRAADGLRQQIVFTVRSSDIGKPPGQQRLRLARAELYAPNGSIIWRVTFDDYRIIALGESGIAMPFSVHIEQPAFGTDILLSFKRIEINPPIPQNAFSQKSLPGMRQELVPCNWTKAQ